MIENLATFPDRWTMRHERVYPHPVERVWDAVTTAEHLEAWLFPACGVTVERKSGGVCSFAWGGPQQSAMHGTVRVFDPPRCVLYQLVDTYLRFDLEPVEGGTHVTFTQGFAPTAPHEPPPEGAGKDADYPAGLDSPWRPGFVAGFHLMMDQLGETLDGTWTYRDAAPYVHALRRNDGSAAEVATRLPDVRQPHGDAWLQLVDVYWSHIRETCPPSADDR